MRKAFVLVTGLVALTAGAVANAQQGADPQAEAQFCETIGTFRMDIASLKALGPQSTVAEVRTATDRVQQDLKELQKQASKMNTPTAKKFTDAVNKLKKDVDNVPENATMQAVQQKIKADIDMARASGQRLAAESGCPAPTEQHQDQQQQQPHQGQQQQQQPQP